MSTDTLTVKTIYATEDNVGRLLKRGGQIEVHGQLLRIQPVQPFNRHMLPLMQGMVNGLYLAHRRPGTPAQPPALNTSERAYAKAWYTPATHTIVLPRRQWAFEKIVLCHEVAHACVGAAHDQRSAHDSPWRKTYAAMVAEVVGPEAGLLLQAAFQL